MYLTLHMNGGVVLLLLFTQLIVTVLFVSITFHSPDSPNTVMSQLTGHGYKTETILSQQEVVCGERNVKSRKWIFFLVMPKYGGNKNFSLGSFP